MQGKPWNLVEQFINERKKLSRAGTQRTQGKSLIGFLRSSFRAKIRNPSMPVIARSAEIDEGDVAISGKNGSCKSGKSEFTAGYAG